MKNQLKTTKILAFFLAITMLFTLASCAKSGMEDGAIAPRVTDEIDATDGDFDYAADVAASSDMLAMPAEAESFEAAERDCVGIETNGGAPVPTAQAGTLTAGAWSDNDNFDFWQEVLTRKAFAASADTWGIHPTRRITFHLVDEAGTPVFNQKVELISNNITLWEAVTDNTGTAYLFVSPFEKTTQWNATAVKVGSQIFPIDGENSVSGTATGVLSRTTELDLCFVVDTTGSMGDELIFLQEEIRDVIERVAKENANADIRVGLVFYRDEGDEYVTREFDFTSDISNVVKNIGKQESDGGDDYPEAIHTALDVAEELSWRPDSTKLTFLVADAPAHSENSEVVSEMRELFEDYAAEVIRLIPVASSGVDELTEMLFRSGAVLTGGEYLFLTDDSGVGDSHLEPTIGDYEVRPLNDLLVETINKYFK